MVTKKYKKYWLHSLCCMLGPFNVFILYLVAAAAAKSLQSCPTLCDPIDGSPPGSPVPGILQARTLERVARSFSNAWKWKVKAKSLSRVRLAGTPWPAAHQAPPHSSWYVLIPYPSLTLSPFFSPLVTTSSLYLWFCFCFVKFIHFIF